jgi:hypothetical protein
MPTGFIRPSASTTFRKAATARSRGCVATPRRTPAAWNVQFSGIFKPRELGVWKKPHRNVSSLLNQPFSAKEEGIPLFHKTFDGNVADARTLHDLISAFARYDLKSGTIVYDRGLTSARNLADIKSLAWETVCGVTLTEPLKKFWRPVVQKAGRPALEDRVQLHQTTFYVTRNFGRWISR